MRNSGMRWLVLLLAALVWTDEPYDEVVAQRADPCRDDRRNKIIETFREIHRYTKALFHDGPPKGVDPLRWAYDCRIAYFKHKEELKYLFEAGPCPEAVAELILQFDGSAVEYFGRFLHLDGFSKGAMNMRISFLQLLEGGDERLKDKLPGLRQCFRPDFLHDLEYLKQRYAAAKKPLPKWYLDKAFETIGGTTLLDAFGIDLPFKGPLFYGGAAIAARKFSVFYEEDAKFMDVEKEQEMAWALHLVESYGIRLLYERVLLERPVLLPQDIERAKGGLKWLWDTKRWWARRYVVEILDASPELAFEGIIEELKKEQHPYVAYRIADLKLIEKLEKQKPKP